METWYTVGMKMPKESKIEKIVSTDPTKRVLENPWLDIDEQGHGTLLASSGQNALVIPVELDDQDSPGPVPIGAIKDARKQGGEILCGESWCGVSGGAAHPRGQFTQFPPIRQLLVPSGPDVLEISLNAKALYELAQAMGTSVVKLRIQVDPASMQHAGNVIGVEPHGSEPHVPGVRAALLPYRIARV